MDVEVKDANASDCPHNESGCELTASSGGVSTALASVLIFTIVVDILGNVLVILSVYRNKKLRNAVCLTVSRAVGHGAWNVGDEVEFCEIMHYIPGVSPES
ncbi:hypothetical protein GOODEAATRI_000735 [Goodea atripinnis]|uniref:Uncharacterized protein n=1 Tax=Goodea atripinnis TaxID=208336 RepID=A0ABV0P326_9TELE